MKTFILSAFALAASTTAFGAGEMETLAGITLGKAGVTIQVTSGGCTDKESFEVRKQEGTPTVIGFIRTKDDFCEMYLPYGTTLTYSWKELGLKSGTEVLVSNSVVPTCLVR